MQSLRSSAGASSSLIHRPQCTPFLGHVKISRPGPCQLLPIAPSASSAAFDASSGDQQQPQQADLGANLDYKPFPRRREGDPYKLLGISNQADFEEVVDARNYLVELYKWHEESRESVELAFDSIIQQKYKGRFKDGFRPPRTGRRGPVIVPRAPSPFAKLSEVFETGISLVGLINEGVPYAAMAIWALFSLDQSFPLAGAFAYSVYKFQAKRIKRDPEGPYFMGNPLLGALVSTVLSMGISIGVMTALTPFLAPIVGPQITQVTTCATVVIMGLMGVYVK